MPEQLIQVVDIGARSIKGAQILLDENRIEIVRKESVPGPGCSPAHSEFLPALAAPLGRLASKLLQAKHSVLVTAGEPLVGMAGMSITGMTQEAAATRLAPMQQLYARGYTRPGGSTIAFHHWFPYESSTEATHALVTFAAADQGVLGHILGPLITRGLSVRALFPSGASLLGLLAQLRRRLPKVGFRRVLVVDIGHAHATVLAAAGGRPAFLASTRLEDEETRDADALTRRVLAQVEDLCRRAVSKLPPSASKDPMALVALGGPTADPSLCAGLERSLSAELVDPANFLASPGQSFDATSMGMIVGTALASAEKDLAPLNIVGRLKIPQKQAAAQESSAQEPSAAQAASRARLVQIVQIGAARVLAARVTIDEGRVAIIGAWSQAIDTALGPATSTLDGLQVALLGLARDHLDPDLPTHVLIDPPLAGSAGVAMPDMPVPQAESRLTDLRDSIARAYSAGGRPVVHSHQLVPYFAGKLGGAGLALAGAVGQDTLQGLLETLIERGVRPTSVSPSSSGLLGFLAFLAKAQPRTAFRRLLILHCGETHLSSLQVESGRPTAVGCLEISATAPSDRQAQARRAIQALEGQLSGARDGTPLDPAAVPQDCVLVGDGGCRPHLLELLGQRWGVRPVELESLVTAPSGSPVTVAAAGAMVGLAFVSAKGELAGQDLLTRMPEEALAAARRKGHPLARSGLPSLRWFAASAAMALALIAFGRYEIHQGQLARREIETIEPQLATARGAIRRLARALMAESLDAQRATYASALAHPRVSWPLLVRLITSCRPPGLRLTRMRAQTWLPEPERMRSTLRIDIAAVSTTADGPRRFVDALTHLEAFSQVGRIVSQPLRGHPPLLEKVTLSLFIR